MNELTHERLLPKSMKKQLCIADIQSYPTIAVQISPASSIPPLDGSLKLDQTLISANRIH